MAKEFTWQGKSLDEIKSLELNTFMGMIPSRQRRSLKRGFTDAQKSLMEKVNAGDKNIKTHVRDMIVLPAMIDMTIKVYNGKEFVPVMITPDMLGHYLGEFSHTRKGVKHSAAGIGATRSSKAVSAR